MTIFEALDQGLAEDQERQLSPELEAALEKMTNLTSSKDTEDEGIDLDSDTIKVSGACKHIMGICASRLAVGREAESHFKAVCRALVSEALELSTFIQKVSNNEADEELNEMALQDWARVWVQVLKDLRNGAKLKHVNYTKTPVEYTLTPYEILMDDIRSKRYALNKVDLPPNVKKDAHEIILDFIRSRPPLKPVSCNQKLLKIWFPIMGFFRLLSENLHRIGRNQLPSKC